MNELEAALKTILTEASTVTSLLASASSVFNALIPAGYGYPAIVFNYQGGGDINDTPTDAADIVYQIKGISAVSMYQAGLISAALHAVLHNNTLTVSGWTNFWCARDSIVRYIEIAPDGKNYYHSGGLYRIGISK